MNNKQQHNLLINDDHPGKYHTTPHTGSVEDNFINDDKNPELERCQEGDFWTLMEDEAIQAHIGEEARKVAQLTAEHHSKMAIEFSLSSRKRLSKALKDQTLPESTDVDSFWSLMENKTIHAHLRAEACKMTELISRDHGGCGTSAKYILKNMGFDQTTCTPKTNQKIPKASVKDDFWSIMEDETSHAHLKEEAHKVADLIARHWGTANRLPQL